MALAIGLMGSLIPILLRRYGVQSSGSVLAAYLVGLYLGAILGAATSVPLYAFTRNSIGVTLGIWSIPAVLALVIWLKSAPGIGRASDDRLSVAAILDVTRHRITWMVTAFMGVQGLVYYATLSWLPILLRARGASADLAGVVASTLSVGGLIAALIASMTVSRMTNLRVSVIGSATLTAIGLIGLGLAPLVTAILWCLLVGVGQGVSIALAMYFAVIKTKTVNGAAAMSGMSQGIGYILAALGPLMVVELHRFVDRWPLVFALLAVVSVLQLLIGLRVAAADRISA
jgi:CP family cyanate transporter-like MFS transporter